MSIPINTLLHEISQAINNANTIMEQNAFDQYVTQGYNILPHANSDNMKIYTPRTFNLSLKQGQQMQQIPVAALTHNTTMRLEQVDITLKFKITEENGKIMIDCKPYNSFDTSLDEMTLQFKNSASTEGISKIGDSHLKHI